MVDVSTTPTGGPSSSPALDALVAFARRSPATQSDVDHVMRSLASHQSWYVPLSFAERAWGQTKFDQTIAFPDAAPTPVLNVFTDADSARLADGQAIGPYGGPVSGVRLLRSLPRGVDALLVNPASPREHQWFIASGGFDIAYGWAGAVEVERALADRGNGPVPAAQLLRHRYHMLVEQATQAVAQITLPDIDGVVAVCFTATDRIGEYLASLPPPVRPAADFVPVDGPRLFTLMRGMAAAGLVINAGSDDQTALTGEDISEIVAADPSTR